jgi:hypothetical protein
MTILSALCAEGGVMAYREDEEEPEERDHEADARSLARQFISQRWPLTDQQARNLTRILMAARAEAAYRPKSRRK